MLLNVVDCQYHTILFVRVVCAWSRDGFQPEPRVTCSRYTSSFFYSATWTTRCSSRTFFPVTACCLKKKAGETNKQKATVCWFVDSFYTIAPNRTAAIHSSTGGLEILKLDKNSIFIVFHISIWGDTEFCLGGDKPTKSLPWRWDWVPSGNPYGVFRRSALGLATPDLRAAWALM